MNLKTKGRQPAERLGLDDCTFVVAAAAAAAAAFYPLVGPGKKHVCECTCPGLLTGRGNFERKGRLLIVKCSDAACGQHQCGSLSVQVPGGAVCGLHPGAAE